MRDIDFEMAIDSGKAFDDAVAAVEQATADAGFRVLHVHDVQATLAEKGFDREPLTIVEICNARYAHDVLSRDVKIALMLPCPIAVFEQDGQTSIAMMRPSLLSAFYPEADLAAVASEVEQIVRGIVEAAAA